MHIIAFQQVFLLVHVRCFLYQTAMHFTKRRSTVRIRLLLLVHVRWRGIFCAKSGNNRWYEKANNNRRGARRSRFIVRQVRFGATKPRAQPHKVLQRRSVGNSRQRFCNSIARRFVRSSQLQLRRCRMRGNPHETARGVIRFCPFCSLFFYFFFINKVRHAPNNRAVGLLLCKVQPLPLFSIAKKLAVWYDTLSNTQRK